MTDTGQLVDIEGRRLRMSHLDKVFYPDSDFTKGRLVEYYARVAPVLLPHVRDRPLTLKRYPNGVEGKSFFEKNVSGHAPDWVRTVRIETPGSTRGAESADFALVQDLPTLMWVAQLASIELHVPQWTVGPRGGHRNPDLLVFDLDPGAPATIVECCEVALWLRDELADDGLTAYPKTSGSKGLQLYAPVRTRSPERTSDYAKRLAEELERKHRDLVISRMTRNLRDGKVLIDWSQNNPKKTTIAPYSLRARPSPTVSTPVTWEEVERCSHPSDLVFVADDVLERVDDLGDLLAPLLAEHRPAL
ncbi:non-homologous end-joining DNA ligase [Saccharomonospora glauca]|jgi:bifunctional non-homologous end joining protein LigD|uniref:DNA polymerase LigD, polymerase domain n=1 Tax=Saccharomonospora glauca K62 TaxID=928724 RepID=I1D700_9PSEU|nr:non-homologous end-joining DNA ligase [Saccharomonospora glauca]EIF00725.1 DNA polymerase LigD, polymerase domain [Saccharomonospora glauca K62]